MDRPGMARKSGRITAVLSIGPETKTPPASCQRRFQARRTGLEPATTGSTVRYSNQLSYRPFELSPPPVARRGQRVNVDRSGPLSSAARGAESPPRATPGPTPIGRNSIPVSRPPAAPTPTARPRRGILAFMHGSALPITLPSKAADPKKKKERRCSHRPQEEPCVVPPVIRRQVNQRRESIWNRIVGGRSSPVTTCQNGSPCPS